MVIGLAHHFILLIGPALVGVLLHLRHQTNRAETDRLESVDLQFPRDLDPAAMAGFMASLAGLLPPWWRRLTSTPRVVFETTATASGITHQLLMPASLTGFVLGQLRTHVPGVRISPVPSSQTPATALAAELRLTSRHRPLRVADPERVSAALLATFHPLAAGELAVAQWIVSPSPPARPIRRLQPRRRQSTSVATRLFENLTAELRDHDDIQAARAKQSSSQFSTVGRVGVVAASPQRRRQLLSRLLGGLHITNAPGVHFARRLLPSEIVARRLGRRSVPEVVFPMILNAAELTAVIGWPLGNPMVPGLVVGTSRQLPVPAEVPSTGLVLAASNFAGSARRIAIAPADALKHLAITGPTGSGKSTLLLNLAAQAMDAGQGLIVIEPHGDLVADCLDHVPARRVADVIVLDPSDTAHPVGLNPLAASHGDGELMVEQVVGLMHQLYASSWGPRTDDVLRASLLTLCAATPTMTLAELPILLADEGFRARLVAQVHDRVLLGFWAWFDHLSTAERATVIAPVTNKARAFLMRSRIRGIIGQATPALDLDRVLAERRILLVSLPVGTLGDDATALLGSLVVAQLWRAVQRRSTQPASRRHPSLCVIDELQRFLNLPVDVGDMLAEARKLGLGLVLAHQHLGQLSPRLRQAVLANARTKITFATTADDAKALGRESRQLTPEDLRHLGPYEVALSVAVGPNVAAPTTGVTLPPSPPTGQREAARAWSRQNYGQAAGDVEAAIAARQMPADPDGSLGRRRRQP